MLCCLQEQSDNNTNNIIIIINRHICRVPHCQHSHHPRCSSPDIGTEEDRQVCWTEQDACLLSICRGNSWCVAWDGNRVDTRDRQTHHYSHRRHQGNHLPVPTPFYGSSEKEYGCLLEHHDHRVKRRCIHYTCDISLTPILSCLRLCASGLKNNNNK